MTRTPNRNLHEQSWVIALVLVLIGMVAMIATNFFRDLYLRERINELQARVEALERNNP